MSLDEDARASSISQLRSRSKIRYSRRSDTAVIMPVPWTADRRRSQVQADLWNPTGGAATLNTRAGD